MRKVSVPRPPPNGGLLSPPGDSPGGLLVPGSESPTGGGLPIMPPRGRSNSDCSARTKPRICEPPPATATAPVRRHTYGTPPPGAPPRIYLPRGKPVGRSSSDVGDQTPPPRMRKRPIIPQQMDPYTPLLTSDTGDLNNRK